MPWITKLVVRYHQQNARNLCGAATAMMLIDSLHGGLVQEETLWPKVQSAAAGWSTDPASLAAGINANLTALGMSFVATFASKEPDGTRAIVEAVCAPFAAPAAALVYRKSHWVLVCNANFAVQPVAGTAPGLLGFYVNSPSLTPKRPPRSHANADSCGTVPHYGSLDANQYVAYAAWKSFWFNGYVDGGKTVFATVCPKKPPQFPVPAPAPAARGGGGEPPEEERVARPSGGSKMIRPEEAKSAALTAIEEHGLANEGPLSEALRDVTPGDPELVRRLDEAKQYYYLVPLLRANRIEAVAQTNALVGDFMGACAVGRDAAYHVATAAEIEREMPGFRLVETVWMPCRESTSPFNPFQRLEGQHGEERYVDRNGNVYASLTSLGAGD
jgi:hypothetical protein